MIRLLLRAYPSVWRKRYGQELAQLVEDVGLTPQVAADVIRGGLRERAHAVGSRSLGGQNMIIGPAWRHPRGMAVAALAVLMPVLSFVFSSLLAYEFGADSLYGPLEAINAWLATSHFLDPILALSPLVAFVLATMPLLRLELRPGQMGFEAVVGLRLRLGNLGVAVLALGVGAVLAWHIVAESVIERGA